MILVFSFFIYFQLIQTKNVVFPFKKLTIEYLNDTKTIADFINFNIYTNVSMGTPPKKVGHFITKTGGSFYYDDILLQYHLTPEYKNIHKEIENKLNIYYFSENSSTFRVFDDLYGIYSDIYYLYDLNQTEKTDKLKFNMLPNEKKLKLYGSLDLYNIKDFSHEYDVYLFDEFKINGFIDNYYFTFFYGEYDLEYKFNYLSNDYSNILGNLIIGESPHELYPNKYKKDDEIKINGIFALNINVIKFKSGISNYSETDVRLNLKYNSEFIKGSLKLKNETDKLFFNELIEKKLCRIDYVNENIYSSKDIVYSCENNDIMKEN